jgi:uncharacterized protein (DUF2147 family)
MQRLIRLTSLLAIPAAQCCLAQTPVGLWQTIDDATKKPKAQIRITEDAGVVRGTIVRVVDPNEKPDAVCELCTDERKGKPVVGMVIVRNLKKEAEREVWSGGDILDPNNGKVYRAQMTPSADNKSLAVRGYIGTPFLGRSQTWQRVE